MIFLLQVSLSDMVPTLLHVHIRNFTTHARFNMSILGAPAHSKRLVIGHQDIGCTYVTVRTSKHKPMIVSDR